MEERRKWLTSCDARMVRKKSFHFVKIFISLGFSGPIPLY